MDADILTQYSTILSPIFKDSNLPTLQTPIEEWYRNPALVIFQFGIPKF